MKRNERAERRELREAASRRRAELAPTVGDVQRRRWAAGYDAIKMIGTVPKTTKPETEEKKEESHG